MSSKSWDDVRRKHPKGKYMTPSEIVKKCRGILVCVREKYVPQLMIIDDKNVTFVRLIFEL